MTTSWATSAKSLDWGREADTGNANSDAPGISNGRGAGSRAEGLAQAVSFGSASP